MRHLLFTCLVLGLVFGTGAAQALTFQKVTDTEVKATVKSILDTAKGSKDEDDFKSTLELAARVRPIVELVDAACPMPVKVTNGTAIPFFNVKVTVTERRGSTGAPVRTSFHLPYLPAKSSVSGTVRCALGKSYGYGSRVDTYLSASPIGEHSRLDDEGIRAMARQKPDAVTSAAKFTAGRTTPVNPLEEILGRDAGIGDDDSSADSDSEPDLVDATGSDAEDDDDATTATARKPKVAAKPTDKDRPKRSSIVGSSIIASALREVESEGDLRFLVTGLLRTPEGARELGAYSRRYISASVTSVITPAIAAAVPARVAMLLEEGMKGTSGSTSPILTAAVARVCGAGQPEEARSATWLAALAPDVANATIRDLVLAKCGVGKEAMRARLEAAKGELLGRALEGMQGDLFEVAVGAMQKSKSLRAAEGLLADTQSAKKFDAVARAVATFATAAPQRQELVRGVAAGKPGALDETKARWLDAQLAELHAQSADQEALRGMIADMAAGKVANTAIRKVVVAHRKDAGPGAFEPFRAGLVDRGLVLSPAWVFAKIDAGEIDVVDLVDRLKTASVETTSSSGYSSTTSSRLAALGIGSSGLGAAKKVGCQASSTIAAQCLSAVSSLALTKEAIDPSFVDAAVSFVKSSAHDENAVKLAQKLGALGIDISPAVEALCAAAPTSPGRHGYGYGMSDPLDAAASLSAGHACVAHVRASRSSAERWIAAGIGTRILLAFVPFGFVALLARKRFVPVRAQLAKENAELEAVRGKAVITERLEGRGADDSITSAITDAARWLREESTAKGSPTPETEELAAAGRALGALPPETLASLVLRTRSLAKRAGETGAASTCLCELDGLVLYLACFPGREDQPQTVRRQPGFADGWSAHLKGVLEACAADGRPKRVLSLVTMLRTDAAKMTMLVAYDSETVHLVPEALVAETGRTELDARAHDHRYEISQNPG